jgi:transcription elongation factor Elf1
MPLNPDDILKFFCPNCGQGLEEDTAKIKPLVKHMVKCTGCEIDIEIRITPSMLHLIYEKIKEPAND